MDLLGSCFRLGGERTKIKFIKEYAFLGDFQEGLAKDDEGYLYLVQDSGGIIKVKDLRKRD